MRPFRTSDEGYAQLFGLGNSLSHRPPRDPSPKPSGEGRAWLAKVTHTRTWKMLMRTARPLFSVADLSLYFPSELEQFRPLVAAARYRCWSQHQPPRTSPRYHDSLAHQTPAVSAFPRS